METARVWWIMSPQTNTCSVPLQLCYRLCISSLQLWKGRNIALVVFKRPSDLQDLHCITSRLSQWILFPILCIVSLCLLFLSVFIFFFKQQWPSTLSLSYPLTLRSKNAGLSASPQPPQYQKQHCDSELSGQSCHTPLEQNTVMGHHDNIKEKEKEDGNVVKWEEDEDGGRLSSTICSLLKSKFSSQLIKLKWNAFQSWKLGRSEILGKR